MIIKIEQGLFNNFSYVSMLRLCLNFILYFIWPVQVQLVLLYQNKSTEKSLLHNIVLWC